jgi:hypothetical protein
VYQNHHGMETAEAAATPTDAAAEDRQTPLAPRYLTVVALTPIRLWFTFGARVGRLATHIIEDASITSIAGMPDHRTETPSQESGLSRLVQAILRSQCDIQHQLHLLGRAPIVLHGSSEDCRLPSDTEGPGPAAVPCLLMLWLGGRATSLGSAPDRRGTISYPFASICVREREQRL